MIIVTAALATCLLWFSAWLYGRRHWYILSSQLTDFFLSLPLVGHTYLFFGYDQENLFARMCSLFKEAIEKKPFFHFWLGPRLALVVTEPEYAKRIIYSQTLTHKDDILAAADPIVGQGMLFGSGPAVKMHRKSFMPAFNSKMLESYLKVFHRHSQKLTQVLERYEKHNAIDIEHYLHFCAFDAVNETTIDVKTNCQTRPEYQQLCGWLIEIYGILYQDVVKPWLYYGRKALHAVGWNTKVEVYSQALNDHLYAALHRKRDEIQSEVMKTFIQAKTEDISDDSGFEDIKTNSSGDEMDPGVSTLEYILKNSPGIGDWDIIVELKNIYMASSDTVAQMAAFTTKMLAVHPHYQERAYEECLEVLNGDSHPSLQQLNRLVFLERCIKESLRLFPIAPLLVRKTTEELYFDDVKVPLDTTLLIGVYWLHRNPRHWQKPNEFYPEHFLPEFTENRNAGAYLPFSGGPHSCIGKNYAMLFMKTILSTILLRYKIEPTPEDFDKGTIPPDYVARMKLGTDITVRLVGGIRVCLSNR